MKTMIELPAALFPKAQASARERGQSLNSLFTEAVEEPCGMWLRPPRLCPWEAGFGALSSFDRENSRIDLLMAAEFETVDNEQWR